MLDTLGSILISIISAAVVLAAVYGLVFWGDKARTDRSASVGIYLLFGMPGALLSVAGLALITNGLEGGWLILGPGIGFSLALFPSFRKLIARISPMDPKSPIDISGLAIILAVGSLLIANNLLYGTADASTDDSSLTSSAAWLILNASIMVAVAYVCVGVRIYRTPKQATERLGLNMPDLRTLVIGVIAVVPCYLASFAGSLLTVIFQPDVFENLENTMDDMTNGLANPFGAVLIGLSAGIGEEVLFRGAIQPRFGIILTALLWTSLHAQYDLSFVLLGLFGVGVVLGVVRNRYGTTAAIIAHALYNIIAVSIQLATN